VIERRIAMARLRCKIGEGARPSEATVELQDSEGRPEYLPVERAFLIADNGDYYLPVSIGHVDRERKLAIVGLPVEADSGAHRIWVNLSQLKNLEGNASPKRRRKQ
jgi:hypothetical protein